MFGTCLGTELKTHEHCDITDTVVKKVTTSTFGVEPAKTGAEISVGWGSNCPPTPRRIANLLEIFILSEVRKYTSYSDKTVIISKFPTN